jgi:hypothetical protein
MLGAVKVPVTVSAAAPPGPESDPLPVTGVPAYVRVMLPDEPDEVIVPDDIPVMVASVPSNHRHRPRPQSLRPAPL